MKALKFMLATATAIGLTTASQAINYAGSTSFEDIQLTDSLFQFEGAAGDNESEIVSEAVSFTGDRPVMFRGTADAKYLKVSTGTDPLLRKVANSPHDASVDGEVYIDTLVQFTVTPSTDDVTTNAADKLLIYLKEDGAGNTNLTVKAAKYTPADIVLGTSELLEPMDLSVTSGVVAGEWHRLTVKSYVANGLLVFNIWIDGNQLTSPTNLLGSDNTVFPSLLGKASTELAAVGFAGEGCVDDLAMTTLDPFTAALEFTLTFGTGVSGVAFTINGTAQTAAGTYNVYPGDAIVVTEVSYDADYMEGTPTATGFDSTDNGTNVVGTTACSLTLAGTLAAAKIGDTKYADLATALSAATAGQTVTLVQDATSGAISTAAGTLDLNGKTLTLSGATSLTFTGTGAATLKGGDLMGVYHELTITAPAGEDLTFDSMTFHASVMPKGSGDLFTVTNCQFLCDLDKTGAAFADGSTADVHSYGVLFNSDTLFAQADIVNSTFDQGRRACVQASFAGDLYFYGNTVNADKLTSRIDGASTRYPALQIFSNGRVFIENNTFSGQYLGEPFCIYNKGTYRASDKAVVFNGNTVANGVEHLWGVYDVDATGSAPVADANVLFGANTVGDQVDLSKCVYKTTLDDAPYAPTPATLALPTGVATVYAWTHAAGATDYYVNGTAVADLTTVAANDTIIAVPGAEIVEPAAVILTADATLKNQFTAGAAVAQITGGAKYATLKEAVDAADTGDTVTVLADCSVTNGNTGITFTKGINLVNNYTITIDGANYAFRIANGTTTPVTWSGTGSLVWLKGSGSPIIVGSNEKKAAYGINDFYEGSFVLNGGTLTSTYATAKGGNLVKLEAGTFVLNDGTINGGTRGVKADSEGNNATCVLTINGGTIVNTNSAAIAASTAGSGSSTVTVNAGTFTGAITGTGMVTIPGTSTAKFDRDQSAFCAAGYETTLSEGWYVVTAVAPSGEEVEPGQQSTATYTSQADAEAALANVTIVAPEDVATNAAFTAEAKTAYLEKFEPKVVSAGEGEYKVEVALTAAAAAALQTEVDADAAEVVEDLSEATVTLTTTPGFYYSFLYGTSLDNMQPAGTPTLATGTTLTLTRPTTANATSGFFKVVVTVTP